MDRVAAVPARTFAPAQRRLGPYVPSLVVEWLRDTPDETYRALDCTLVFADVSGFTRMTEMLGGLGKVGAEEMAGIINGTFESLLRESYYYGGGLIKWGGDAVLLMFRGSGHAERGTRAAHEMQAVMRRVGGVRTSRGALRLRMSIAVHSAPCDLFLVGHADHCELLALGPAATTVSELEKLAEPGQIVVSDTVARALTAAGAKPPTVRVGAGWLLKRPPEATSWPPALEEVDFGDVDISPALCASLREYILDGGAEYEHRHAAIGFLKFTGVDRLLADEGPAAVAAAADHVIAALQSACSRHGVFFLATDIGGDCGKVMLSAGAPRRLGRDEERMAAALREAIDAGGRLPVSAGATAGRVFVGDFGPTHRRTYSVMGDCANLAARLCAHAGAGELLVNDTFKNALEGRFPANEAPAFAAKGKRAPVVPTRLGSPTRRGEAAAAQAREEPALIGRADELGTLLRAAQTAAEGTGRAIELVGEPGIGKSRLLAELRSRAPLTVFWTDGDIYGQARPYDAFERLLAGMWGIPGDAGQEAAAAQLEEVARQHAPHLLPWLPLIGAAIGLELPLTPEVQATDPALRKARLDELTSELMGLVCSSPTALIFNDVHLMDDASRGLIRRIADDARARPWLVVVSARDDVDTGLAGVPIERLELLPLKGDAAAELLASATVANPLPPHRLLALAERAAGNPLYLRELAAQLSAGGDPDSLPSSVEEAIAARIDRLGASDRRVLRAASVLGVDVDVPVLKQVLESEPEGLGDVDEHLDHLDEFVEPIDLERRRFSHQLIREVAYDALPYRRRVELHARTADALEVLAGSQDDPHAELLSLHLFHGRRYEAAWRLSRIAAERARGRYAPAQALDSYRRALDAADRVPRIAEAELATVNAEAGELCVELGEMPAADLAFRRALRHVRRDPVACARVQLELARLRDICGQHAAAMRWTDRAESTLEGLGGAEAQLLHARLAARRARVSYRQGRHQRALEHADAAIALARQSNDRRTLALALEYRDLSALELGLPAGDGARQALAIYEESQALADQARVHNTLGMIAHHRGAWPEALTEYRAAEAAYERAARHWDGATAMANAAEILADQGRLEDARATIERAQHIYRGVGAASEVAFCEYQLGRIAARLGQPEEARRRLAHAREHFRASGEQTEVVVVDALSAEAALLEGDHTGALERANATLARARARGGLATVTPLLQRVRAAALLALGDRDAAQVALAEALEAARSREADHEVVFTLRAVLELDGRSQNADALREELERLTVRLGLEPDAPTAM